MLQRPVPDRLIFHKAVAQYKWPTFVFSFRGRLKCPSAPLLRSRHVDAAAFYMEAVPDDQGHIPVNSRACIPPGAGVTAVDLHHQFVPAVRRKQPGDLYLKCREPALPFAGFLSVNIKRAIHVNTVKMEKNALPVQNPARIQFPLIPANTAQIPV